jgi:hypothetical protein
LRPTLGNKGRVARLNVRRSVRARRRSVIAPPKRDTGREDVKIVRMANYNDIDEARAATERLAEERG